MRQNLHSSPVLRIFTACIALLLIGIILLKPHSGLLSDDDSETIEMTVHIDENDFEGETYTEIDTDILLASVMIDRLILDDDRSFGKPQEKALRSIFNDIFLPPPEY